MSAGGMRTAQYQRFSCAGVRSVTVTPTVTYAKSMVYGATLRTCISSHQGRRAAAQTGAEAPKEPDMFTTLTRVVVAVSAVVLFATPALAGPPLICHPFVTESGKLIAWGGGSGWNTPDHSYDIKKLVADTTAALTPDAPVLTRMENLRRATIYAMRDPVSGGAVAESADDARAVDDQRRPRVVRRGLPDRSVPPGRPPARRSSRRRTGRRWMKRSALTAMDSSRRRWP